MALFLTPLIINVIIAVVVFGALGGRRLVGVRVREGLDAESAMVDEAAVAAASGQSAGHPAVSPGAARADSLRPGVTYHQLLTLVGILALAVGTVAWQLDVGFLAMTIAVVLAFAAPNASRSAVSKISWSTVLLICGVLTYVGVLQAAGTVEYVSAGIASLGSALLAALLLCYFGGSCRRSRRRPR